MKTRALRLALPLLALLSCRDNRASIQIQAICAPTKDCKFGGTCDAQYINYPVVDSTGPGELHLLIQVENQLQDNTDKLSGKLNTNDAYLDQAVVDYDGIGLPRDVYDLPSYRIPANGSSVVSLWPVRGSAAGRAALAAYGPSPSGRTFVANLRLRGRLDDGSRFETGQFSIGVNACTGCLPADPCPGMNACPTVGMEPVACGSTSSG